MTSNLIIIFFLFFLAFSFIKNKFQKINVSNNLSDTLSDTMSDTMSDNTKLSDNDDDISNNSDNKKLSDNDDDISTIESESTIES